MWYKDISIGDTFYNVPSPNCIQKFTFSGWCNITHADGTITDNIMSSDGAMRRADITGFMTELGLFPESELKEVIEDLKGRRYKALMYKIQRIETSLKHALDELSTFENSTYKPKYIDFTTGSFDYEYDWKVDIHGRLDDDMYSNIHV